MQVHIPAVIADLKDPQGNSGMRAILSQEGIYIGGAAVKAALTPEQQKKISGYDRVISNLGAKQREIENLKQKPDAGPSGQSVLDVPSLQPVFSR